MFKPFETKEAIKPEGREYAQRALMLGGLTFASIAILFDAFRSSLADAADVFLLLVLSLGFLFLCYSVEVLIRQARIFWIIEDKSLTIGYLAIVLALLVLLQHVFPDAVVVLGLLAVALLVIHCYEFYSDFTYWRRRGRSTHNHVRLGQK